MSGVTLLPWEDERGITHGVPWNGAPSLPSALALCGRRSGGCRVSFRFDPDDPLACAYCRRLSGPYMRATAEREAEP